MIKSLKEGACPKCYEVELFGVEDIITTQMSKKAIERASCLKCGNVFYLHYDLVGIEIVDQCSKV